MQWIAGRTVQEYNQPKNQHGAFWEDWYHVTAIEPLAPALLSGIHRFEHASHRQSQSSTRMGAQRLSRDSAAGQAVRDNKPSADLTRYKRHKFFNVEVS